MNANHFILAILNTFRVFTVQPIWVWVLFSQHQAVKPSVSSLLPQVEGFKSEILPNDQVCDLQSLLSIHYTTLHSLKLGSWHTVKSLPSSLGKQQPAEGSQSRVLVPSGSSRTSLTTRWISYIHSIEMGAILQIWPQLLAVAWTD